MIEHNYGDFKTGVRQYVFEAKDPAMTDNCEETKLKLGLAWMPLENPRALNLKVLRGACPNPAACTATCAVGASECTVDGLLNLDFRSATACTCEVMTAPQGDTIYDLSLTPDLDTFSFDTDNTFTIREWVSDVTDPTSKFAYDLPADDALSKCFTKIAEPK
jgi:hypothetical protein